MKKTPTPFLSFVILNYNGKKITEKCIESLLNSIEGNFYEVIVVDNESTDGSARYIKERFPFVKILEEKENKFIYAYNDGVRIAKSEWVFLLNNDMIFEKGFLKPILEDLQLYASDDTVFAIGSKLVKPSGETEKCVNCPYFRNGYFWIKNVDTDNFSPTIYVGTHAVFNREKFLKLEGFSSVYSPFYSEDLDLCYRAWKKGWKVYIEPKSKIYHYHMATIGKFFSKFFVLKTSARNHFLFMWINITERKLILKHILFLPVILAGSSFLKKWYYIPAFFEALKKLKEVVKLRKQYVKCKVSDTNLLRKFKWCNNPYE